MNLIPVLINLLTSFSEFFCGCILFFSAFPRRESRAWIFWTLLTAGGAIHTAVSFLNVPGGYGSLLIIMCLWLSVFSVCFDGAFHRKLLIVLSFWAVSFAVDYTVLLLSRLITAQAADLSEETGTAVFLISSVAARTLLVFFSFTASLLFKRSGIPERKPWTVPLSLSFAFIPVYSIFCLSFAIRSVLNADDSAYTSITLLFSTSLLAVNMFLHLMLNLSVKARIVDEENRLLQVRVQESLKRAEALEESFREQRKITHEFHSQLDALTGLLENEEYRKALAYLEELSGANDFPERSFHTNHQMTDAILFAKCREAEKKGLHFHLVANDLSGLPLDDATIVTLLGNLLDNAIEAASASEQKTILVRFWHQDGAYALAVQNSLPPEHSLSAGKKDPDMHGYGLKTVQSIMDQYHLLYTTEVWNGKYIFSTVIR